MTYWDDKRVVVTGGAGFLGKKVHALLEERGAKEVFIPRSSDFDLTTTDGTGAMFEEARPDVVMHLAARVGGIGANMASPADIYTDNLLMGTNLIEEARRRETPKMMIVGTICSYPKFAPAPFREESLWDGYPEETNAPYGIAKKALLVHAQANRAQYGQNCIYLLPTNLYGPGDKFDPRVSHVIPALIKKCDDAIRDGADHIVAWGTGQATREFLYVDDAARALVDATEVYEGGEPINLGSGEEVSIETLIGMVARLSGFEGDIRWDHSKPDGQPRRLVDTTRAHERFGFVAEVKLEEGLRRTIEWYRANPDAAA
jgi:GDP-L-fucose synthase